MTKVLLGFAFGHRGPEPGLSNEDMGSHAVTHWNEWQFHSIQREIAQVTERLGFEPEHTTGEGGLGQWYHTQELVHLQLDALESRGYNLSETEYYVLCHRTHWSGCLWFLKKELTSRGVIELKIVRLPVKVRYDRLSWQKSNRSPIHILVPKIWRGIQSILRREISLKDVLSYFLGKYT